MYSSPNQVCFIICPVVITISSSMLGPKRPPGGPELTMARLAKALTTCSAQAEIYGACVKQLVPEVGAVFGAVSLQQNGRRTIPASNAPFVATVPPRRWMLEFAIANFRSLKTALRAR